MQKARGTAHTQKFRHFPKASVNCFPARSAADGGVMRVQAIGAVVRIELERRDTRQRIEAELSRERQAALQLRAGELIHARPASFASFPLHAQQSALNTSAVR